MTIRKPIFRADFAAECIDGWRTSAAASTDPETRERLNRLADQLSALDVHQDYRRYLGNQVDLRAKPRGKR